MFFKTLELKRQLAEKTAENARLSEQLLQRTKDNDRITAYNSQLKSELKKVEDTLSELRETELKDIAKLREQNEADILLETLRLVGIAKPVREKKEQQKVYGELLRQQADLAYRAEALRNRRHNFDLSSLGGAMPSLADQLSAFGAGPR